MNLYKSSLSFKQIIAGEENYVLIDQCLIFLLTTISFLFHLLLTMHCWARGGGKELIKYLRNSKLSLKKTAELIPRYYRLVNLFSTSVILPTAEKTSSQKGGNSKYGLLYKKFQF